MTKKAEKFKSALNEMVMKVIGRPIRKDDLIYTVQTVSPDPLQYQARVRIIVLNGIEFEGEQSARRKDAEHSAAKAALSIVSSNPSAHEDSELGVGCLANHKGHLQELLGELRGCSRAVARYETLPVSTGGFVCKVHVMIDDKISMFQGELHSKIKEAQQSAAAAALQVYTCCPSAFAVPSSVQEMPGRSVLDIASEMGVVALSGDFKSTLNELVMKVMARSIIPEDVQYSVRTLLLGNMFQATVSLANIDSGLVFQGEPRACTQDAEQSAAQAALSKVQRSPALFYLSSPVDGKGIDMPVGFAGDLACSDMPVALVPSSVDSVQSAATASLPLFGNADGWTCNFKSVLNELVMKLISRPLSEGDIVYDVSATSAGLFVASLQLVALSGSGYPVDFVGTPRVKKRDSEQAVAQLAWTALHSDRCPEMLSEDDSNNPNSKSSLNELVMKFTGRPLRSTDVVYSSHKCRAQFSRHPGPTRCIMMFQATVKVAVIDDTIEFAGEYHVKKKEAEQSAASVAHAHFSKLSSTLF